MKPRLQRVKAWHWVTALGLVATVVASSWLGLLNQQRLERELDRQAEQAVQQVAARFGLYEYGLRGARGAVLAGGGAAIRRETFAGYSQSRELSREFPGARGFGFIRQWPVGQDEANLQRARADGMPGFKLRELSPNPGDRFVIEYIYPMAPNAAAIGLDTASESLRRDAAIAAAHEAAPRLTSPITLVQADQKVRQGFLMFLPMYRPGALPVEPDARLAATVGWTYAPLLAEDVLRPVAEAFPLVDLSVEDTKTQTVFFRARSDNPDGMAGAALVKERALSVFGRDWRLRLAPGQALALQTRLAAPWLVVSLGLLLTLLASLVAHLALRGEADSDGTSSSGGLLAFLRSALGRWALLALLLLGVAYGGMTLQQVRQELADRIERDLRTLVNQRTSTGAAALQGRLTALQYLRGTPPVNGLIRSDDSGRDPRDGSARAQWLARMGDIFASYGQSQPEVKEVRLVRLARAPSVLVSWQRSVAGGESRRVDAPLETASLRALQDLRGALLAGKPWVHPVQVDLVAAGGPLGEPLRQRLRYTFPVLDGASLFGVLEVDVDLSDRFTAKSLLTPWRGSLHVLSHDGRWLSRQGVIDGEPRDLWGDRYSPQPLGLATAEGQLRRWQGPRGEVLSVEQEVDPNPGDRSARLIYRAVVPMGALDDAVQARWLDRLGVPVSLAGLLYGLIYVYWRLQRRHQAGLNALNQDLARRVDEQTQALQAERIRLSNILEGTGAGTWEWNCQTGETRFNERWAEILGYAPDAIPVLSSETWMSHIHPEDRLPARQLLAAHFKGETPQYVCEHRLRHQAGHWVWAIATGRVMTRTPEGRAEWVSGTLLDVSELRAAQAEREQVGSLLRGVLQAATEFSIIATDPEGLITVFNAGAERLLGYRADEVIGRQTPALVHLPAEVQHRGEELSAAEGEQVEGFRVFVHLPERQGSERREWTYVRKDGIQVPVSLTVSVVRNERAEVVGYLGIAQDISERLASERALRLAKTAAEAASEAKGMFLANMSHEIRTPMNAVIGIAHLLADSPLNADQRQLLSKLQVAGRSLLGVINDVLDLSKIEAGELVVEQRGYHLAGLLLQLDQIHGDTARAKGLGWSVTSAPDLPEMLVGDPQRLQQVLSNLLSNAIKFTHRGEVSLHAEPAHAATGSPGLRFSIRDTGVGISAQAQAQLFKPFVQAEASTTRQYGGTGLGLSIVKHLVELMDGSVSLRSEPGQGSVFSVDLPLQVAEQDLLNTAGTLEALIVEDEPLQRERLTALCEGFGWQTQAFETSEAWLALMVQRHARGLRLPDVLLIDWHLGDGLDGLSALRQLRASLPAQRLPAALLITQDQESALQTQDVHELVDAVLAKPASPSLLFNAVNEAIAKHSGNTEHLLGAAVMQRLGGGLLPGVRLLVVDDSDINLEVARRMLERQGATVLCDSQAEAALSRLAQDEAFDAVLMDIQMPGMDGLEATRQIRQRLQRRELPVIALTAGALLEERRRAAEAGMDDFLTKPLDPEALVRTLRRHIETRRGAPLPVQASAEQAGLPPDWPAIDGIDAAATAHRLGGDAALFCRLLARLLQAHEDDWLAQLGERDAAQAAGELHKLRGSAGLLGAERIQALAAEGETRLRAGTPPAELAALRAELGQALSALRQAAAPWLRAAANAATPAGPGPGPSGNLADLLHLLRQQDLEAADVLRSLREALIDRGLSDDELRQVEHWVDELDYESALHFFGSRGLAE